MSYKMGAFRRRFLYVVSKLPPPEADRDVTARGNYFLFLVFYRPRR